MFKATVVEKPKSAKTCVLAVLLFGVTVVGLLGCLTPYEKYTIKSLYSIIEQPGEDIGGKYIRKELLIYKKIRLDGSESITISAKDIRGELKEHSLILRMSYTNWRFPNSLGLNIDGNLLHLTPTGNARNVTSPAFVEEAYIFILSKDVLAALANASVIKLQVYKDEVITIDYEGIAAIRNFLEN